MSDAIDFVELDGQQLELLPARTVLSLFTADAVAGENGTPGVPGANGQSITGTMISLFSYAFGDGHGTDTVSGGGSPSGIGR